MSDSALSTNNPGTSNGRLKLSLRLSFSARDICPPPLADILKKLA
ncbi:hypothetical protein [Phyllobacterium phragmitis]|nr:hypothetical protein [Phyllobacterium phragmitis]